MVSAHRRYKVCSVHSRNRQAPRAHRKSWQVCTYFFSRRWTVRNFEARIHEYQRLQVGVQYDSVRLKIKPETGQGAVDAFRSRVSGWFWKAVRKGQNYALDCAGIWQLSFLRFLAPRHAADKSAVSGKYAVIESEADQQFKTDLKVKGSIIALEIQKFSSLIERTFNLLAVLVSIRRS